METETWLTVRHRERFLEKKSQLMYWYYDFLGSYQSPSVGISSD